MSLKLNTLDDFQLNNKTVLIRVDINSPVDPHSGIILDDTRMKLHAETIQELSNKGAKTVILAHQSRPGKKDFTTLEQHAHVMSKILNHSVIYVEDIFGCAARETIGHMKKGDILLLENVRFYSEEVLKREISPQSATHLVNKLAPVVDYFVNDAFAAAHRSQPSLIGFTFKLPSAAGRIMEKELKILTGAMDNVKKPCTYVLGGVKADDSIHVMQNVLENGSADYILTTGLVANIFLQASGIEIGTTNHNFIENKGYNEYVDVAGDLITKFKDNILIPVDVAICEDNKRIDISVEKIPDAPIYDIGIESIKLYAQIIRKSSTIFANGPAGVFENPEFSIGTADILNSIASSSGFSIIGGGHLAAAAIQMGFEEEINHISSGGGACINLLAGEKLPAVEALKNAYFKKLNDNL